MIQPLPCIACGAQPESVWKDGDDELKRQPYGATTFYAYGQYGSTVWDPMGDDRLMVNICDPCLIKHSERVVKVKPVHQESKVKVAPWTPPTGEEYD
jgi:hypothetical protein